MNLFSLCNIQALLFILLCLAIGMGAYSYMSLPQPTAYIISGGCGIIALGIAIALYITHRACDNINLINHTVHEWSNGILEDRFTLIHKKDDAIIGQLMHTLNRFLDITDAYIRESQAAMAASTKNIFYRKIIPTGLNGAFKNAAQQTNRAIESAEDKYKLMQKAAIQLHDDVNVIVNNVNQSANAMGDSFHILHQSSSNFRKESNAVMDASGTAENSISSIAAATEQLSTSIRDILHQVTNSSTISKKATDEAANASTKINSLKNTSERIAEFVTIISDIAEQTNLLALNATIEASRAGEAGKGFAVVAGEVKNLANNTVAAADQITEQVSSIQAAINDTIHAIDQVNKTIHEVKEISNTINNAVNEQNSVTLEISSNMQTALHNVSTVSTSIKSVDSMSHDTARTVSEALNTFEALTKNMQDLEYSIAIFSRILKVQVP